MSYDKSLYNDYNALTKDGLAFENRVYKSVRPLMEDMKALGYNPRELSHVITRLVECIESEMVIEIACKMRRDAMKVE